MSGEGKAVCVTGASGFIASWIVKLLLDRGYSVHATVRSLGDPKKTEHLLGLDGANERLSLFEANLTEEGSFDSAVNGCVCVFHTASPVQFEVDDPQAQLIEPAVKGTLNVLKSAAKVPSLKRVVLTSSMAAVMFGVKLPESGGVVDETWFSNPLVCEQKKLWYHLSKTLAEDAAVKFSNENSLELVVVNPGFVIGPILQPILNVTSEGILGLIKSGKEVFSDGIYRLVDVRDVANAHILAFEKPQANGRYLMVCKMVHSSLIMKILDKLYPTLNHSDKYKDSNCVEQLPFSISRAKAESLGVEFTPLEITIKDTVESLKEKNLLNFLYPATAPVCKFHQVTGSRDMNREGTVVCVTGASGFIASWLVKLLLARGYFVHATVRSLDDPKRTEHLLALDGAKDRLSLFEANLSEEGSFDSAVNGCVCVFHTASPALVSFKDPQVELIDPAVNGTLNVLRSAAKVPSLKRFVFTSSSTAVMFGPNIPKSSDVVDETWFSDPVICEQKKLWYALSKTLAEDAAVKFSKENNLKLVTVVPGLVIGPLLQPTLNFSSEGFMRLITTGKEVFPDGIYRLVDVRDVATAHVLAFEEPHAKDRYLIVGNTVRSSMILKIVHELYPAFSHCESMECVEPLPYSVSRVRAEGLGVEFIPFEAKMNGQRKVVCVTGASGFIASWLVKLLLAHGYTVHATVRSLDDPKKTEHLLAFEGAKKRLTLFEANLTEEGSFDSAVNGCVCVFHTASPVIFKADDPQVQLIDPAVEGTLNVLRSAVKVPCLKRVVLTSSIASVFLHGAKLPQPGIVIDETWFSDPVVCEQKKSWYSLSKTLAEDAAARFSKQNGLDLVSIHPGYSIGPFLQPTLNLTSDGILNFIKTGSLYPDGMYRLADVRDVAMAHILAFEKPSANGRYCIVGIMIRSSEIMKIVNKLYPSLNHSERHEDGKSVEPLPYLVSRARAESLGVEFTPVEITIKDTIDSLKEKKLLSF
uniref:uncharacterized protein LOC122597268 n=1 Tax=Erigeron canadensis TaxID=72917 RepID=UPI001CB97880|nr:uncharacterized protein LOC122597268 [Erigeron canadensis]